MSVIMGMPVGVCVCVIISMPVGVCVCIIVAMSVGLCVCIHGYACWMCVVYVCRGGITVGMPVGVCICLSSWICLLGVCVHVCHHGYACWGMRVSLSLWVCLSVCVCWLSLLNSAAHKRESREREMITISF